MDAIRKPLSNIIGGDFQNLVAGSIHRVRFFGNSVITILLQRIEKIFSPQQLFELPESMLIHPLMDSLRNTLARGQEWLDLVRVPCDPWCKLKPTGESCRILSRSSAASFARCSRLNGPSYRCDRSRPTMSRIDDIYKLKTCGKRSREIETRVFSPNK